MSVSVHFGEIKHSLVRITVLLYECLHYFAELPAKSESQRRIKLSVDSRKGYPLAGLSNYRGLRIAE